MKYVRNLVAVLTVAGLMCLAVAGCGSKDTAPDGSTSGPKAGGAGTEGSKMQGKSETIAPVKAAPN